MTYQEAVDYIEETPKFTTKHPLDHTRECLRLLGDPQKAFRVIHVAGTNGKGSTCACLDAALRAEGYACGLFTSPHLVEITERFKLNGENVSRELFLSAFHRVHDLSLRLEEEGAGHPTYFEMLFLMGMLIFREAGMEVVVLETGLGGRLDATTAVSDPLACVITSISLDHMQYLGDTVPQIAAEKAGILVQGVPVVYDGNDEEAAAVIRAAAKEKACPALCVRREDAQICSNTKEGITFRYRQQGEKTCHIPFIAEYQVMNAMLALRTLEMLREVLPVSEEAIHRGFASVRWPGRMEQVLPGVIVDGAHNEDGVRRFVETAAHFGKEYPLGLLFSAVEDKEYEDMIHTIAGQIKFDYVITTQVGGYRQVPAETLAQIFHQEGVQKVEAISEAEQAFVRAVSLRPEEGLLFCVGSLYLVGDVKNVIRREAHD